MPLALSPRSRSRPRASGLRRGLFQGLVEFLVADRTDDLAAIDDEGRRGLDLVGGLSVLRPRQDPVHLLLVGEAGVESLAVQPGQGGHLGQGAGRIVGPYPDILAAEQRVEETEMPVAFNAVGDRRGAQAERVEREVTVDDPRLARGDPVFLHLRQGIGVKFRTVRAGER